MSQFNHSSCDTVVHIERLVLRGIDPHHAEALAQSLKQQLVITLSDPTQRQQLLRVSNTPILRTPALRLDQMPLAAGRAGARDFGARVARAIGARISGMRPRSKGDAQ